jgi:diguanylate cyclase
VQLTSAASGLPNIGALAAHGIARSQDVVAVSVSQYEQMLASLPRELHGECARQIARRLSLGSGDHEIFDNDNGSFVWLENSQPLDGLIEHLEGLKALFSSPLTIHGHVLDTNVHFGLDRNIESNSISRIQSALASASEAQAKGKLYEEFGQQRLAQSPWELSLHARIDEGLRNGDIWLALQPQYDFRTCRISGAEALIRWNDPERGAIPPDAFILQAERAGRIEKITYWVLEKSIIMSRELNRAVSPFQISVNLSAQLVDHPMLVRRVADIVRETGADCSLITFEVTETFNMANREEAKRNLSALRAMGFRLSIDDFGTGQASLAYLAEIPSDEIKLDRRFVQAITSDARERTIVDSVIKLAHSLGQEVVAEGIEDVATLEALRHLGCDLAQGYYVGRPMPFSQLTDMLGLSQVGAVTTGSA